MSYTFSRRNFMKYTALTAVAVAGSSLFTGCSNPNQPVGKTGDTLSIIGKHQLKDVKYADTTLTCNFHHIANTSIKITPDRYEVRVTHENGETEYYNTIGENAGKIKINQGTNLEKNQELDVTLTVTDIAIIATDTVQVRFNPRSTALANDSDSYADCYATWIITDALKDQLSSGSGEIESSES